MTPLLNPWPAASWSLLYKFWQQIVRKENFSLHHLTYFSGWLDSFYYPIIVIASRWPPHETEWDQLKTFAESCRNLVNVPNVLFAFFFFLQPGQHDAWDSYCADKQLQIYLASQLVGGWVVRTRGGRGSYWSNSGGKKKLSVAILPLLMLLMVKRNHLHPTMRNLCNNSAL